MDKELWESLEQINKKEEKERLLENITEEEAKKIFDKYSSIYNDALRRLS